MAMGAADTKTLFITVAPLCNWDVLIEAPQTQTVCCLPNAWQCSVNMSRGALSCTGRLNGEQAHLQVSVYYTPETRKEKQH